MRIDDITNQLNDLKIDVHNILKNECSESEAKEFINEKKEAIRVITELRSLGEMETNLRDVLEHIFEAMDEDGRPDNEILEQMGAYALAWDELENEQTKL